LETERGIATRPQDKAEYEELLEAVKKLRDKLSLLFFARDKLFFHVCGNIEALYMIKIGALEYKLYELECKVMRIKRKIELIQTRLNRQEGVILTEIEAQLDAEYARYADKLRTLMNSLHNALRRRDAIELSKEEAVELKSLYRKIIKSLHPDLNPNVSEKQKKFFVNAAIAYKNADLPALKTIWTLLADDLPSDEDNFEDSAGLEELRLRRNCLKNQCDEMLRSIKTIRSSFPYNQRAFLRDERKMAVRAGELNDRIEKYREAYSEYEGKLNAILGRTG
jgi:hypothetical protein